MSKILRRKAKHLLIVALCVSCCAVTGCVESTFQLADSSRLPKWITIPPGLTRTDVSVTMNYYVGLFGRTAEFIEKDEDGKILSKVNGRLKGPCPLLLKNPPAGFSPGYPTFEVITVNGQTDIIEHKKMEPIFYVNDDPNVRKELLAGNGHCK